MVSLLTKLAGTIVPVITTTVDEETFTLHTHTHVPGIGDFEHTSDLAPLYDAFINRMVADGILEEDDGR